MRTTIIAAIAMMLAVSCYAQQNTRQTAKDAVLDNIFARTSVRAFTDQPVPEEMVETLLKAGMAAPTAMNSQPWSFVVINDKDVLNECGVAYNPPMAIVVCGDYIDQNGNEKPYWEHDCSAATENILLAAQALGLGAVWTAGYPGIARIAHAREVLGLPENIMPLCIIPIGYPAGENKPKDKWDPGKVHYNKW